MLSWIKILQCAVSWPLARQSVTDGRRHCILSGRLFHRGKRGMDRLLYHTLCVHVHKLKAFKIGSVEEYAVFMYRHYTSKRIESLFMRILTDPEEEESAVQTSGGLSTYLTQKC